MRLQQVAIERFQNFTSRQEIEVESGVTCLVGKNESGKTTILKALHRLNPANGVDREFRLTPEYPMAQLARDRRKQDLDSFAPVSARFLLEEEDLAALADIGVKVGSQTHLLASRTYANDLELALECDLADVVAKAVADSALQHQDDIAAITGDADSLDAWLLTVDALIIEIKGETARAKAVREVKKAVQEAMSHLGPVEDGAVAQALTDRLPRFFYFDDYDILPGKCDLTELNNKLTCGQELTRREQTVLALLTFAGESPQDFMEEDYVSRNAELQSASADLSDRVFEYWKQNEDLSVKFVTEMPVVENDPSGREVRHHVLRIELRDERHGGVETNFETRSAGFQWFFSFLAAFSGYQSSEDPVIVLLDEPGTRLHGEAQKDFVRYIYDELGASQQVLYTTHSQFMIDPMRYETIRAVHDRATRQDRDAGVVVSSASLATDRDTILPIEAALGYTISQHLILGSGSHLIVEGSSDFVYLARMSAHLSTSGREALNPEVSVLPVGTVENVAPFVALVGKRIPMTVLIDGEASSRQFQRIEKAAESAAMVSKEDVLLVSDTHSDLPKQADIEDLFEPSDYLWLYNRVFGPITVSDLPSTSEPLLKRIEAISGKKFDHALPAHELTRSASEFFAQVQAQTLDRFEALIARINEAVSKHTR